MRIFARCKIRSIVLAALALPFASPAFSDDERNASVDQPGRGTEKSLDQLAAEMSNPLAVFTSLGYELDYRTYQGDLEGSDDQTSIAHHFNVVIPFKQKDGKGWVLKMSLPYVDDQPIYYTTIGWTDYGLPEWKLRQIDPTVNGDGYWNPTHGHTNDLTTDLVYGGVDENGFILQYGVAGQWPTSSDTSNARQQLILGPEINIGKIVDWGTYGALVSHVIDVAEKRDKGSPDTTITTIDAYFSYALGNGWQLYSSPKITYDWEGDSGNKLSVPVGGGVAKTVRFGKTPVRFSTEIQKYVVSTDRFSSDWFFKFSITPVLANQYTRH
jgi:hypothetical protein